MEIAALFATIANPASIVPLVTVGWGTGRTQQSFIQGGSPARSNLLSFYLLFLAVMVPLSYTFH